MNVDKSIRILERVCCDEYLNLSKNEKNVIIREFYSIDENEKPINYRGLTISEIEELFSVLNPKLKEEIKKDLSIEEDIKIVKEVDNNKEGADALISSSNVLINLEMKFGSETLANIGQSKMDELFNTNVSDFSFKNINESIMNYQRDQIDKGINEENKLIKLLKEKLNEIILELNQLNLKPNNNKINDLLTRTGNRNSKTTKMVKYKILPKKIEMKQVFDIIDSWKIEDISIPKDSARIQIILGNNRTKLKFLLNWKNNYEYPKKSGKKYSAKTGGTTSCWNVWLYIE